MALMLSSGHRLKKPYTTVDWDTSEGIFINCCQRQETQNTGSHPATSIAYAQSLFPFQTLSCFPKTKVGMEVGTGYEGTTNTCTCDILHVPHAAPLRIKGKFYTAMSIHIVMHTDGL